jgi:hypothetical protein
MQTGMSTTGIECFAVPATTDDVLTMCLNVSLFRGPAFPLLLSYASFNRLAGRVQHFNLFQTARAILHNRYVAGSSGEFAIWDEGSTLF